MSLDGVRVKEDIEIDVALSQELEEELYMKNDIKYEVESGPELLQTPGVSIFPDVAEEGTHVTVKKEFDAPVQSAQYIGYDFKVLKSCSVRLERLPKKLLEKYKKHKPRKLISECWICEFCKHIFNQNFKLKGHMKAHVKQLLYNNDKNVAANFGYIVKDDFDTEPEGRDFKLFTCDVCMKYFANEIDIYDHMKTHGEPVFKNENRNEKNPQNRLYPDFLTISSLKPHSFFCISCNMTLRVTLDFFISHLLIHIEENPLLKQILQDFVLSDPIKNFCNNLDDKVYTCDICQYTTVKENFFRKHMKGHLTNINCSPIAMKAYSRVKASDVYRIEETKVTNLQPIDHQQITQPLNTELSLLAHARTSNQSKKDIYTEVQPTDIKSSNESIDFQKSSLFSRLKSLNQVVRKS